MNAIAKAKAAEMGQQGVEYAKQGAKAAFQGMHQYIQGGPAGVSVLCFLSGCATAVIGFLNIINIFGALTSPFTYLLNSYLCVFGVVTFLLEVDVDRMKAVPGMGAFSEQIMKYHDFVCDYCKFLTLLKGRGLFYVFIGSFAITQMSLLLIAVGLANLFCGVVCVLMGFGYSGDEVATRLSQGYAKVASAAGAPPEGASA